jgi:hypothetical protein
MVGADPIGLVDLLGLAAVLGALAGLPVGHGVLRLFTRKRRSTT